MTKVLGENVVSSILNKKDTGISCKDYETLMFAALPGEPPGVQALKRKHEETCCYHNSSDFLHVVLSTPITVEITEGAQKIIEKHRES